MADLLATLYPVIWTALIVAVIACGVWVFFSIRQTLASTLVFDIVYMLLLITELLTTMFVQPDPYNTPVYIITLVTFFLNLALTCVIFIEWRNAPVRINEYVLYLKFALSIIGIYTAIPLGLYYLRLYYLPRFAKPVEKTGFYPEISGIPPAAGRPAPLPAPPGLATPPPELAGRYEEWRFLGKGGFARVFAVRKKDGKDVALKVPLIHDTATGMTFIAELQNWTQLDHGNIVRVHEYNILPVLFFEMELCDSSLADEKKPMPPLKAAAIIRDLCEGLDYSHRKGIIHRDLKPSNILLKDGMAKISDWGLSRVLCDSSVTSSQVAFTPYYAAPEQILGSSRDNRTDIWQAGAIFYELVTGTLPFRGDTMIEVLAAITTRDPEPPSRVVPGLDPVDRIILRCLARNPEDRYRDAKALQDEVGEYLRQGLTDLLNQSISRHDLPGSARCCGELLLFSLRGKDMPGAYRYASELAGYCSRGQRGRVTDFMKKIEQHIGGDPVSAAGELLGPARELVRDIGSQELVV